MGVMDSITPRNAIPTHRYFKILALHEEVRHLMEQITQKHLLQNCGLDDTE
jgi:hypothetical protein